MTALYLFRFPNSPYFQVSREPDSALNLLYIHPLLLQNVRTTFLTILEDEKNVYCQAKGINIFRLKIHKGKTYVTPSFNINKMLKQYQILSACKTQQLFKMMCISQIQISLSACCHWRVLSWWAACVLRNSASSFHWLSSSIFKYLFVRSSRIRDTSSHLHYMMFQTIQTIYFVRGYDPGNMSVYSLLS